MKNQDIKTTTIKDKRYEMQEDKIHIVAEPSMSLYLPKSFLKNSVLDNLSQNSIDLFTSLIANSGLTIKTLAESIFEITPKTFIKYKNTSSKIPSRIAELAIELNTLYTLGNDIFGNKQNFNSWLNKENVFINNQKPAYILNTSTGIHLIYEELKRIEFGATA